MESTKPTTMGGGIESGESIIRRITDDKSDNISKMCFVGVTFLEDMMLSNFKSNDQASNIEVMISEETSENYLNLKMCRHQVEVAMGRQVWGRLVF